MGRLAVKKYMQRLIKCVTDLPTDNHTISTIDSGGVITGQEMVLRESRFFMIREKSGNFILSQAKIDTFRTRKGKLTNYLTQQLLI